MNQPLKYLKEFSRKRKRDLKRFLRGLSHRKVRGIDSMAKGFHKDAFEKIDCLKCANCCKTMTPTWKKAEVKRVAKHMGITYEEYFKRYLKYDKEGDLLNKKTPCQHLLKNNMCGIYELRPVDCSGFPHTHNRDFKLYVDNSHLQNVDYCPATLFIIDKMFEKIVEKK